MTTAIGLYKHGFFLYLLIFGILTWTYRRAIFKNAQLAIQYRNRELGYNRTIHRNVSGLNVQHKIVVNTSRSFSVPEKHFIHSSVAVSERKASLTQFSLWKSINLHPEDKKGREKGHRYGDPLQLYLDSENKTSDTKRTQKWQFIGYPNKFINCTSLFLEDINVPGSLQKEISHHMQKTYNDSLLHAGLSCNEFVRYAGYITEPLTQTEAEFPIAYSILMYTDVEQVEILLRTIYRPQNVYCIHVDKTSPRKLHDDVKTIANCFHNVFMTPYSIDVIWGKFSVLEAEMACLRELWKNKVRWKYFINLTGQDFPLRTNYELVKILRSYNGANNVNAGSMIKEKYLKKEGPPPYKLTPVIGSTHVVLSREFVDFLLHNETSLAFYNWTKNIYIPDEKYFSTMNYNKHLKPPGGYRGEPQTSAIIPFLGRLKHWIIYGSSCHGKVAHLICIFGTKDLPLLATREELFVNKLHFGFHPEVMLCMQELLYNRTVDEYEGRLEFNVTYYATRDFVKNKF